MFHKKNPNAIKEGSSAATVIMYAAVFCICLMTLYPFYYVFVQSIGDPEEVAKGTIYLWPKKLYFGSYKTICMNPKMWRAYGYTILYVVGTTTITLVSSILAAYPLSVKNLWGRKWLIRYMIIPMYFSGGLIPTYLLMLRLGLYNTIWAMILPGSVNIMYIILVRTFFMSIPRPLIESASLDGAGHIRTLTQIMLPLAKPVLAVVAIYTVVFVWNSWFNAMLYLPDMELHPLQFYLYRLMINQTAKIDITDVKQLETHARAVLAAIQMKFAMIIFTTLPVIFTYPFFQKYFVKGVMLGSLKE